MGFEFTASDLSSLSPEQTSSILHALLLASVAGPTVDADEVQRFQDAIKKLPVTPSAEAVAQVLATGRVRYESTDPGGFGPWIGEIAASITDRSLREKTLALMGIVSPDFLRAADPGVLGAAIVAFEVSPESLSAIQKAIGESE